jgi:ATP-binding cassette subfamily C protein LapB
LQTQYSGYCLYARPEILPQSRANNPFDSDQNGHWFWGIIRQNSALYRDIIIAAIVINLFAIASPMFVMNVYDRVVPNNAISTLWVLVIGMVLLLATDLVLKMMRSWFVDLAASRTDIRLSSRLLDRVLSLSLQFKPASSGSLASHLQSFESVRSFISSLTLTALADLPFLLLFIVIIALISWPLVIPIIVGSALILIYAFMGQRKMHALSEDGMKASTERTTLLLDSLSNLDSLKSFNLQSNTQAQYEKLTLAITHNSAQMRFIAASVSQNAAWVQQLVGVSIIIIGVYLIGAGDLSQGGLIASYLLSSRALAPVGQAAGLMAQYHHAHTAMSALEKLMSLPSERDNLEQQIQRADIKGQIEFNKVSYAYPDSDILALNQVSFKIRAGERVAILGKNGSGKSTIEKLLLGLYPAKEGQILIDGLDIKQLDIYQLRRQIGYVPQDVSLLLNSLKANISSDASISDERILGLIQEVGLLPFVQQHPQGLSLPAGERGSQLSGGQRQAVAIARALILDPAILILDEPTSSLDYSNEELIKNVLAQHSANKTLILVTHRTPLLALVDRLIVIDQGRILADGPKDTVMEALRQGRIIGATA